MKFAALGVDGGHAADGTYNARIIQGNLFTKQGQFRENTGNLVFEILWVPCPSMDWRECSGQTSIKLITYLNTILGHSI